LAEQSPIYKHKVSDTLAAASDDSLKFAAIETKTDFPDCFPARGNLELLAWIWSSAVAATPRRPFCTLPYASAMSAARAFPNLTRTSSAERREGDLYSAPSRLL